MQRVELEASHSQLQIVDKLNQGIRDQKRDQGFANDMLEEIARAVGVAVEPSEISKELASFRREKEEAANRKERAEVFFLEQVIELLSRADAARDYEEVKKQYRQRRQVIERYDDREEYIPPLNSFLCCICRSVMTDPVSLCTGTTCERDAIIAWLDSGKRTDPETGEVLEDVSLRSNLLLRQSIEEWRELNYCLNIRSSEAKLSSDVDSSVEEALSQMQYLLGESSINKDWVSIGGLTDRVINILGRSHNRDVKRKILITLKDIVEGHARNKEKVFDSGGWDHIIPCLGRDSSISKAAVELLYELLQERSGWNVSVCRKLSQQCSAIIFLVTLLKGLQRESAQTAEKILMKLFEIDEENISRAAKAGWYKPLIDRIVQVIVVKCSEILEKLTSEDDGIKFFVDEGGAQLELELIITDLLALQQKANSAHNFRRPALRTLLGICKFEAGLVKKAVLTADAVSLVLPLLDDSDSEIREIAINLLFLFSQHEPQGVVEYLLKPRRLEALVGFLENEDKGDVQMAAAGLLANLPKSEGPLTMKLIELDGIDAILKILRTGTIEAKENALSALFRFSDPTNIKSQRILVERGAYPLLVNFLRAGSLTAKARAAALIGTLSMSSPKLTVVKSSSCWCFRPSGNPLCPAHGGICSVTDTFCLLEAKALPDLVKLLSEEEHATAYEAIQTLSTLILDGSPQRGANVLHKADAIKPILETLTWGMNSLKEEALGLLENVFVQKEMVECYGSTARGLLVGLTAGRKVHEDDHLGRKAAKVLTLLERYSRSSTSFPPGL
ncbi:hypothetical protein I3842_02G116000 [Carya illinoinensis]|uniref:U-box domain-containing protein n=2 Tax=Carya illinoinensis TaxID=32201 RepID=A0A922FUI9_CARIL|nr:hypothetical protein I3842_02G116000 [Carya illinoinensis]KAG6727153.1 hypothetical protein I3842_02G116000 [Carya illinoinensis]